MSGPEFESFRVHTPLQTEDQLRKIPIPRLQDYAAELGDARAQALDYIQFNRTHYLRSRRDLTRLRPLANRGLVISGSGVFFTVMSGGTLLLPGLAIGGIGAWDSYKQWKYIKSLSSKVRRERAYLRSAVLYVDGCTRTLFLVSEAIDYRRVNNLG